MSLDEIVEHVQGDGARHVEATGGEPLAQPAMPKLLTRLCDAGQTVLIETSGALDISVVEPWVHIIMDIKCPDSGMTPRMRWKNINLLETKDEVKFVIASRGDYEFARRTVQEHQLPQSCTILFSTAFDLVDRREVVEWMLEDRLDVRFQVQMHKFVWAPDTRGV